jgi:HK97 family phage prohead protease/HK97 family phage major capsid protein
MPPSALQTKHLAYGELVIKAVEENDDGERILRGFATTPQPDRMQDIVEPKGAQFALPLPLLAQHDHAQPIGHVTEAKVTDKGIEIVARIVKDSGLWYVEQAWKQLKAKLVRGFSIGFRPIEYSYLKDTGGIHFTKWDWLELSTVTVPANSGATISSIKAYGRTAAALALARSASAPSPAALAPKQSPITKRGSKMSLAERITAKQAEVAGYRKDLEELEQKFADGVDPSDEETVQVEELAGAIEKATSELQTLQRAEKALATQAVQRAAPQIITRRKEYKKGELVFRLAALNFIAHVKRKSIADVMAERYAHENDLAEIVKAAQNPAFTNVPGWAQELVQEQIVGFLDLLEPESIYPKLRARGVSMNLTSPVKIPGRDPSKRMGGAWVGEGAPIPVRGGRLTSQTLGMHKLAVISTFTRELAESSTPSIESIIRQFILEDTALTVDQNLLDDGAASATRPAGLKTYATEIPATGATEDAIAADLQAAIGVLVAGGGTRDPVWLINPGNALYLSFLTNALGESPQWLRTNGQMANVPYITSGNVPMDEIWLVDAADFVTANGDNPEFDVSDVATIHEEDTNPLPIIAQDAVPAAVASSPVRSLWQTYSVGVRMVLPISWAMRRTGMVAVITGVQWPATTP